MAQRRMFSKKITDTDKFLEMPLSTQALYFHLNMGADDDGFVDRPKTIQRIVGASDDDLKLLLAKNFIISSDSGIVVIKDWRIHNYIRKDTYQPTIYQAEKLALEPQMAQLPKPSTSRPRKVDAGKDRIGKDRIGKDSIDILCHVSHDEVDKSHFEIIEYLNLKTGSKFKPTTKPYIQAIRSRLKEGYTVDDFKTVIDKKCREWKGTKLEKYLTPKTLFAPSHFDTYLNSNEMSTMTDTERKVAELNALIDAVERGTDETGNIESYGPTIDISEY